MANTKADREPVDGAKWIEGWKDVTRWFKDLGISLRGLLFLFIILAAILGTWALVAGISAKFRKPTTPAAHISAGAGSTIKQENNAQKEQNGFKLWDCLFGC